MVNVAGTGSTWNCSGTLSVGYYGGGTLSVADGGSVRGSCGYIGYNSGSTGMMTVDGTGSTWGCNRLYLGQYGDSNGMLSVTNGGTVTINSGRQTGCYIGYGSDASGGVIVDGDGSTLDNKGALRRL